MGRGRVVQQPGAMVTTSRRKEKKDLDAVRRGRCAGVLLMHKTRAQVFVYLSARLGCLAAP